MKAFKLIGLALFTILMCLSACSSGGDDPIEPTPKPEVPKSEITIDSSIISNGLSFSDAENEQTISFTTNENWTLNIANTTSGATWCTASTSSGTKGSTSVKFTVTENTTYDNRSVSVTIKSGTATKTFTITQKSADALLVTTDKYEVSQEGGTIEIEVKANIDYKMEISEKAKDWIKESSSRALTTYKHKLDIAVNEDVEKREGEITFKSGDKVETVKVYQAGGAIILLSQDEYTVSDAGEMISVEIKSNVEFGVQMPDVDWITDEASSRGMSSHTLKYAVAPNEGYDNRSAEIIFYDKNSDLKDTLKVVQAQKNAIVISEKNISVVKEGGTIEVKVNTNVEFEIEIPSDATWITQTDSRALTEKSVYLKVSENMGEESRSATVSITNKESQMSETIVVTQQGNITIVTLTEAGTMKKLLGSDYLNIASLKVVGPINGDDVYYLRKMLGGSNFSQADWGKLETLDLSDARIVEGGEWYFSNYYTANDVIGGRMFICCAHLKEIVLPDGVTSIGSSAFSSCSALTSVYIKDLSAWCRITFWSSNPLKSGAKLYLDNKEMTELVIPEDITEIKQYAFCGCGSIVKVVIPDNVTSIGSSAFYDCSALTTVTIGDGVTSIDSHAFQDCDALTTVTIGDGVTSIGSYAFVDCNALTNFYCHATTPPSINFYSFSTYDDQTTLHVPARCGSTYKSRWGSYFKNIVEMD